MVFFKTSAVRAALAATFLILLAVQPGAMRAQQAQFPPGYAGTEACVGCHDDGDTAFRKNRHYWLETNEKRGWKGRSCEACHGPGAKHSESALIEDITNPPRLKPSEADKICLGCHRNQPTQIGRLQNGHARSQTPCTSCHNVHKTGAETSAAIQRTAAGVNKQCSACHTDVWTSFQKPHRHSLNEGGVGVMKCTDCHNPHGSNLAKNVRTVFANEPGCLKCHSDKRGPFIFEHAPVRNHPCSTCHEPHGSANPRMLTRHEVANLCLECHANLLSPAPSGVAGGVPTAVHDLRQQRWRQCTMCHQKIHGSNVSRGLLR